ncbi:MAG: Ni/Fe hydrogenase subunit alpha [Nanoarchaeota archaeon]|nr:Ni/Fe hydrogenase subunit alpha [Nanoarchaeota archaeon]
MARTITLDHITKIEGHAKLRLKVDHGKVKQCHLTSTEGARYFEGIVKGRRFNEAHEITSRICGICSCAHVIAAIQAVEDALGVVPTKQTVQLRLLMTLGERIRSHATHLYFLSLPDYLGYESALAMAKKYRPELQRALDLMRCGNGMIKTLGARDLHPVSATVGGWLHLPTQEQISEMGRSLESVKRDALSTCELFNGLKFPEFQTSGNYFSLVNKKQYPALDGAFGCGNQVIEKKDYKSFIKERHEADSTANFVVKSDKRYFVGALARINNNSQLLSDDAKRMLKKSGVQLPSLNPYHNNVAQAVELVHCIDQAREICGSLIVKQEEVETIRPRAGTGVGMIEVPRGTLWHEYTLNKEGIITKANIITPTAQNLLNIQEDIRMFVPQVIKKPKKQIVLDVEKLIRSYDPCFSCSAHFLEVDWK